MDSKFSTRFAVASEQTAKTILHLAQTIAREKYAGLLSGQIIDNYITANFNEKVLVAELNSMSNQWLVVYSGNSPVGFARVTSKGGRPLSLTQNRVIRIADFSILASCTDSTAKQSLFDKCWTICQSYQAAWILEYCDNPFIEFFRSAGFSSTEETKGLFELPLPSVCLIREGRD